MASVEEPSAASGWNGPSQAPSGDAVHPVAAQPEENEAADAGLLAAAKSQTSYDATGGNSVKSPKALDVRVKMDASQAEARGAAPSAMKGACVCILVVELCERLAFYTFIGTQEPFLESGGYTLSQSAAMNSAMTTLCMAWSLAACWAADVGLGRYNTILAFGFLYAVGSALAAASAWPSLRSTACYLFALMVLVPIGTAGIKANISNFGADQYDASDPEQKEAQERFFNWFYLSINLGSAVAYGYLTTLGSNGGVGVPKSHGYFAAYAVAAGCMLLGVLLFRSARHGYKVRPLQQEWAFFSVCRYVAASARSGSRHAIALCVGTISIVVSIAMSVAQAMWPAGPFAFTLMGGAFVCASIGVVGTVLPCLCTSWLASTRLEGASFSNAEVRSFLGLLPVLITANLAFGALYNSMQYWYQQQACQMDLRVPWLSGEAQLAGSFFMIADCLAIVVATPLALGWFNPLLERHLPGRFGHATKFGLGMAFGVMSVALAARFEMLRRASPVLPSSSNCAPAGIQMSGMNAAWMILPFFLMGVGEIYTQPVIMHFAYTRSPPSMQTLVVGAGALIGAVSNGIFTVQIAALSSLVPNDLNQGRLEFGYFSNIAVGFSFYAAYVYCAGRFCEKGPDALT